MYLQDEIGDSEKEKQTALNEEYSGLCLECCAHTG